MYEDFLKDIMKEIDSKENEIEDTNLSNLIVMIWLKNKMELDDNNFKENFVKIITELGSNDLKEDEELNQILFMFGYKMREDIRLENKGFRNRMEQHYGLEFYYLELFEILSRELGALYEKNLDKLDNSQTEKLLRLQHIRACSIYAEVIHLIKGGYGTGALTRFRSLHELAVITEFIISNGEAAADCYFDYLPVMQKKDIIFQEKVLGEALLDENYGSELEATLSEIEHKRGKDFVNVRNYNDYVWAEDYLLKGVKPSFNQIRNAIQRKEGIKPYKIASNNIHSAPRSLTSSLGTLNGEVNGGASNIGVSLPGTWSTHELLQINILVFEKLNENESIGLIDRLQGMFTLKMMTYIAKMLYSNFPNKEESLFEA